MRELKFRAWDAVAQKMVYSDDPVELKKNVNSEVLVYTGEKGKNGVEIYENDIIKTTLDMASYVTFKPNVGENQRTNNIKGVVKFIGGSFVVEDIETHGFITLLDINIGTVEVLGNTYENPNLLK